MVTELALPFGTMLFHNTFRIEKVLGNGGFGITYLAHDISLDRKVAIKEFFPKDYCDRNSDTSHITLGTQSNAEYINSLRQKFLKEAKNLSILNHTNIVGIFNAFEENGTAYYAMDYIEGKSLSELVKESGPLPIETALSYINAVGDALQYVHSKKLMHLDVKPANIMLRGKDRKPILIDFGLAKQYDEEGNQTSTTPTGISHGYAPLEQYKAGGVSEFSPQTDVYSLGATLYYLLIGTVPPEAVNLMDNPLQFPAHIPMHIRHAITVAMATSRKARFASAYDFCFALNNPNSQYASSEQTYMNPNINEQTRIHNQHTSYAHPQYQQSQYQPQPDSPYTGQSFQGNNSINVPKKEPKNTLYIIIGVLAALLLGVGALIYFDDNGKSSYKDGEIISNSTYDTSEIVATSESQEETEEAAAEAPMVQSDFNSISESASLALLPKGDLSLNYSEKKIGSNFTVPAGYVRLSGNGDIDGYPITLKCYLTPTGEIYGRYKNVTYNVNLDVNGYVDNYGGLHIQLGHNSETSHMEFDCTGGGYGTYEFEGYWGNEAKHANLTLKATM